MENRCSNVDPARAILAPWVLFALAVYVYLAIHDVSIAVFLSIIGVGMASVAVYCLGGPSKNSPSWGASLLSLIANILTIIGFILSYIFH